MESWYRLSWGHTRMTLCWPDPIHSVLNPRTFEWPSHAQRDVSIHANTRIFISRFIVIVILFEAQTDVKKSSCSILSVHHTSLSRLDLQFCSQLLVVASICLILILDLRMELLISSETYDWYITWLKTRNPATHNYQTKYVRFLDFNCILLMSRK